MQAATPLDIWTTMRLSRESWIILAIGTLDLATTLLWVGRSGAQEANPIFRYYLAMGPFWFVLAKFVCLLCPILLLEFARVKRPGSAIRGARIAIAGYLMVYVIGVANLNPHLLPNSKRPASEILGTLGPEFANHRVTVAEHTFRMPMSVYNSFPSEGIQ
jgi:hypothetical protein